MTQTINHQKFYKNVMAKEHEPTILVDLGELPRHLEVLLSELTHINFKVYGHTSPFLNLLKNVDSATEIDIDSPNTYKEVDFVVTNRHEVAVRGQLSGAIAVDDVNKAVKLLQNIELTNLLRVEQYEAAYIALTDASS